MHGSLRGRTLLLPGEFVTHTVARMLLGARLKCVIHSPQVQELHGTPWAPHTKDPRAREQIPIPGKASSYIPTPALTPSLSVDSDLHVPVTPPLPSAGSGDLSHGPGSAKQPSASPKDLILCSAEPSASYLRPSQPAFFRRPSHDLFECIEQSKDKRLSEAQARFVFAQIVEAVHYLDSQGVTHCDIKDENILVDGYLNVRFFFAFTSWPPVFFSHSDARVLSPAGQTRRFW